MKIYLAARFARRDEIKQYAEELKAAGLVVTARWPYSDHAPEWGMKEYTPAMSEEISQVDWDDLQAADTVVNFTEPPDFLAPRGSRHVEFGAGLAWGKQSVVVGYKENFFHYRKEVVFFPTWEEAKEYLVEAARNESKGPDRG